MDKPESVRRVSRKRPVLKPLSSSGSLTSGQGSRPAPATPALSTDGTVYSWHTSTHSPSDSEINEILTSLLANEKELESMKAHVQQVEQRIQSLDTLQRSLDELQEERKKFASHLKTELQQGFEIRMGEEKVRFSAGESPLLSLVNEHLEKSLQGCAIATHSDGAPMIRGKTIKYAKKTTAYSDLTAKVEIISKADRHGWLKRLTERMYYVWGSFCLAVIIIMVKFLPAVGTWLKLPPAIIEYATNTRVQPSVTAAEPPQPSSAAAAEASVTNQEKRRSRDLPSTARPTARFASNAAPKRNAIPTKPHTVPPTVAGSKARQERARSGDAVDVTVSSKPR